jgi:hypothetical protein
MCEKRTRNGAMKDHPPPVLKINGNLCFRKADVDSWLLRLTEQKARATNLSNTDHACQSLTPRLRVWAQHMRQ